MQRCRFDIFHLISYHLNKKKIYYIAFIRNLWMSLDLFMIFKTAIYLYQFNTYSTISSLYWWLIEALKRFTTHRNFLLVELMCVCVALLWSAVELVWRHHAQVRLYGGPHGTTHRQAAVWYGSSDAPDPLVISWRQDEIIQISFKLWHLFVNWIEHISKYKDATIYSSKRWFLNLVE